MGTLDDVSSADHRDQDPAKPSLGSAGVTSGHQPLHRYEKIWTNYELEASNWPSAWFSTCLSQLPLPPRGGLLASVRQESPYIFSLVNRTWIEMVSETGGTDVHFAFLCVLNWGGGRPAPELSLACPCHGKAFRVVFFLRCDTWTRNGQFTGKRLRVPIYPTHVPTCGFKTERAGMPLSSQDPVFRPRLCCIVKVLSFFHSFFISLGNWRCLLDEAQLCIKSLFNLLINWPESTRSRSS